MPERRKESSGPLPQIVQAFQAMEPKRRNRIRMMGAVIMLMSIGVPQIAGAFVDLSMGYLIFSGVFALVGSVFVVPEVGFWLIPILIQIIPGKILPSKLAAGPDRRNGSSDEEPRVPR